MRQKCLYLFNGASQPDSVTDPSLTGIWLRCARHIPARLRRAHWRLLTPAPLPRRGVWGEGNVDGEGFIPHSPTGFRFAASLPACGGLCNKPFKKLRSSKLDAVFCYLIAVSEGFEPPVRSPAHLFSRQAPSTTRTTHLNCVGCKGTKKMGLSYEVHQNRTKKYYSFIQVSVSPIPSTEPRTLSVRAFSKEMVTFTRIPRLGS